MTNKIYRRCDGIMYRETQVKGEYVIMSLDNYKYYYKVDAVAAKVWKLLDGRRPMEKIVKRLEKETSIASKDLRKHTQKLVGALLKAKLIEAAP